MEKKKILIIVIAAGVIIGAVFAISKNQLKRNIADNTTFVESIDEPDLGKNSENINTNSGIVKNPFTQPSANDNTPPSSSPFSLTPQPTNIITYSVFGYSPSLLEVVKGSIVVFENTNQGLMWPASADHPTHKEYPVAGGCAGSAFDACKGVSANESWSFTFNETGTWKYHDHLLPSREGIIVVK